MSTIIGLVSTFRLPLQKCGGMDMVEEKRRGEVQKKRGSAMKWTFKINETSQSPI